MGDGQRPFVAFFCPNCGSCVNEPDLELEEGVDYPSINGSSYTCGWCHTRQSDWGHVRRCREAFRIAEAQRRIVEARCAEARRVEVVADLVELQGELRYG